MKTNTYMITIEPGWCGCCGNKISMDTKRRGWLYARDDKRLFCSMRCAADYGVMARKTLLRQQSKK